MSALGTTAMTLSVAGKWPLHWRPYHSVLERVSANRLLENGEYLQFGPETFSEFSPKLLGLKTLETNPKAKIAANCRVFCQIIGHTLRSREWLAGAGGIELLPSQMKNISCSVRLTALAERTD